MNFDNCSNKESVNLFVCDYCGKSYHIKVNYKNHLKIHNKNFLYCSYQGCYQKFNNKYNKDNHERIFHQQFYNKKSNTLKNVINRIMDNFNPHLIDYSKLGMTILNKF